MFQNKNNIPDFILDLKSGLRKGTTGLRGQMQMAPRPSGLDKNALLKEAEHYRKISPPEKYRQGAVLILFYCDKNIERLQEMKTNTFYDNLCFSLIRRTKYPGVHSGQISFPGGAREPDDKNLTKTALRECQEEIGVNTEEIEIIGSLTDIYIEPSNFNVHPVISFYRGTPSFIADPNEVEKIIPVSVNEFLNVQVKYKYKMVRREHLVKNEVRDRTEIKKSSAINIKEESGTKNKNIEEIRLEVPYFDIQDEFVWGATAMILSELKDLLLESLGRRG